MGAASSIGNGADATGNDGLGLLSIGNGADATGLAPDSGAVNSTVTGDICT